MSNAVRLSVSLAVLVLICILCWVTVATWVTFEPSGSCEFGFRRLALGLIGLTLGIVVVYLLLGRSSAKEKFQSVALIVGSISFCLLFIEIPVLLFGYNFQELFKVSADPTAGARLNGINRPDPVLIHIHWPNSSFSGNVTGNLVQMGIPTTTRYQANVKYDRNGFRNSRAFDHADIAVIGDSFIEAAIVDREKSLVAILESRLSVPTINLGQIGYGLRQELEVLKRFALPLSPKLVVWALFGGNDLRDVKSYERDLSRLNVPEPPVPTAQKFFLRNVLVFGRGLIENALRNSYQCPSELALNKSGIFTRSDGEQERVYFGQTTSPWTSHDWEVAVDTLKNANRLTRDSGSDFVLVYIPRKFSIYRDHITVSPDHYISRWDVNNLPQELEKWSIENQIKFIDTTPFLEALVAQGKHPYFVDDVHWNELGHETAAKAVIDYLYAEKIFPFLSGKR